MPNITIYMNNDEYIQYLSLPEGKKRQLKDKFLDAFNKEVKQHGKN